MATIEHSTPPSEAHSDATTRERLLEAAEALFAEQGFESVSLRDLTHAAGANLASVNYHFGSKDHLIEEVVLRSLNPMNRERIDLLTQAEAAAFPDSPTFAAITDAFLRPVLTQVRGTRHTELLFSKLMGRCLTDRGAQIPERARPLFQEVIQRFGSAIDRSHPGLSMVEALWRLNFTAGALISTLIHGEMVVQFTGETEAPPDTETLLQRLVAFCAQGLAAPPSATETPPVSGRSRGQVTLLALCGLLGAMTSCAAVNPASRMAEMDLTVPGTWAATDSGKSGVDDAWIENFRDARLSQLVDEALTANPDLRAAAARVDKARGNARLKGADALPTVDLNFTPARTKRNFIGFPAFGGDQSSPGGTASNLNNSFGLSLDMQWELDVWGRIRAGHEATLAEIQIAEAEERAARVSLTAQVARAWFALGEAKGQLLLAQNTEQVYADTAQAVRERFKAGHDQNGAASQLRLAETDVATAKATIAERQQAVDSSKRQLEILLGRYPAGKVESAALPAMPTKIPPGLPSELLQRRPDVLAAERRFAAAGKRVTEAKRAVFPRLSLTSSAGTSTENLSELLNSDFGVWNLAANAVQPILYAGKIQAGKDIRFSEEKEALAQLQKTVLQAFSEVETALAADQYLVSRVTAIVEAQRLAEEADQSARADYQQGLGDLLTVFVSQNRVIQAKAQLLAVQRLRLENRVNLHLALGGDYRPHAPSTATAPH